MTKTKRLLLGAVAMAVIAGSAATSASAATSGIAQHFDAAGAKLEQTALIYRKQRITKRCYLITTQYGTRRYCR